MKDNNTKLYKINEKGEKEPIVFKDILKQFIACKAYKYNGKDHIFNEKKCVNCEYKFNCLINK